MARAATLRSAFPWGPMLGLALLWLLDVKVAPYNAGITDLGGYQSTAQAIADGSAPYRDFFFEYPPLAAGVMVVAGWIGGLSTDGFLNGMGAEMLVFGLVMQVCAYHLAPAGRKSLAAWLMLALPILMGTLVRERFDVAPTAICAAAVLAIVYDRAAIGGALLGVGGALKLFPLLVLPFAVVWFGTRGRRRDAWVVGVVTVVVAAAICAPFFAMSPHGFTEQFRFHADRPVQIESTPASVLFATGGSTIVGVQGHPTRFRSQGFEGGPEHTVRVIFEVLQIAALLFVLAAFWRAARVSRGSPEPFVLAVFGALIAFMAFGKVFSVQYMIWLAPFAAVAWAYGQREIAGLVTAAFVFTWAYYPTHYWVIPLGGAGHNAAVLDVAARNAALVIAFGLIAARLWSRPAGSLTA